MTTTRMAPAERLATLLSRRRFEGDCWIFTGSLKPNGYGSCRWNGTTAYTHRVAYELMVGPIPDGLQIDHLCRVRACFRPDHLEPVTQAENGQRRWDAAPRTECSKGHALTPGNTYSRGRAGGVRCRICADARGAAYRARKRAA